VFPIVAPFKLQLERNENDFLHHVVIIKSIYDKEIPVFTLAGNILIYSAQRSRETIQSDSVRDCLYVK